jgi:hypothetical protein
LQAASVAEEEEDSSDSDDQDSDEVRANSRERAATMAVIDDAIRYARALLADSQTSFSVSVSFHHVMIMRDY